MLEVKWGRGNQNYLYDSKYYIDKLNCTMLIESIYSFTIYLSENSIPPCLKLMSSDDNSPCTKLFANKL